MIATLLVVTLAFLWLLKETDWLRIRLPAGKPIVKKVLLLPAGNIKPVLLLDTIHYKPSQFEPLDMPDTTGGLNIICRRC